MKLSVIVPAYNTVDTLAATIKSIYDSGVTDYEIIIVDDGSKDDTPAVCNQLTAKYDVVRCIHQPNRGVSSARNHGIQAAEGDYIWFFDSDDLVDPGSLKPVMQALHTQQPDMLLFGMSFDYYHKGKLYRRDDMVCEQEGLFSRDAWQPLVMSLYACNYLSPVWNKFIRRELILENHIQFSETMHLMEDCFFTLQCMEHCAHISLLPNAIYRYRQPEDEGNAARRLKRIPSLVDYMEHFSILPQAWRGITESIYFMLLNQKVGASSASEISEIAADHRRGAFAPKTEHDRWLCQQLDAGNYQSLYLRNLKNRARHKAAVFAKSRGLYKG